MHSKGEQHQEPHQSACMVAHDVGSKLAAIVDHCDLLNEVTEQAPSTRGG